MTNEELIEKAAAIVKARKKETIPLVMIEKNYLSPTIQPRQAGRVSMIAATLIKRAYKRF